MSQTKAQLISDLVQALNFTGTSSAPANGMYLSAANTIKLATNSNGRLTIDSSGNATFTGTCTATTFIGALTGNATSSTTVRVEDNESVNENNLIAFIASAGSSTGNHGLEMDGDLTYNPSSGALTATTFVGALTGNASGSAATVTGAAQTAITSVGTLTNLQVVGDVGLGVAPAAFGSGVKTILLQGGSSTKSGCIDFKEYSSGTRLANIFAQNDTTYGLSIGTQCSGEDGDFIRFHTGTLAGTKMYIKSDGKVGIGTTNPATLFHIKSDSADCDLQIESTGSATDARINLYGRSDGVSQIRFGDEDDSNVGLLTYDHTDNYMSFRTADAERTRIDSSGDMHFRNATTGHQGIKWYKDTNLGVSFTYGEGNANPTLNIYRQDSQSGFPYGNLIINTGDPTTPTQALKLRTDKHIELTGSLIMANGQGVDFSATSEAGGKTSELLDDYEEGTWTPSDESGAGLSFSVTGSVYTKIGRMVYARAHSIVFPTTSDSNTAHIGGLPFSCSSNHGSGGRAVISNSNAYAQLVDNNTSKFWIYGATTTSGSTMAQLSGAVVYGLLLVYEAA